ncbi:hypothetical protein PLICRDRAFT_42645 [Plicaturopsis crispa FD-325 SS-3]|nr:hypothetical protein PLICRDRAFT_42645 [Plicaturopsis crispa FD-325 SS-3]
MSDQVYYCGYLLNNDWLIRRGLRKGLGTHTDTEAARHILLNTATIDVMSCAKIPFGRCRIRAVYHDGAVYACIAIACNDPMEGMPVVPLEEDLEKLKRVLRTQRPPHWFPYA